MSYAETFLALLTLGLGAGVTLALLLRLVSSAAARRPTARLALGVLVCAIPLVLLFAATALGDVVRRHVGLFLLVTVSIGLLVTLTLGARRKTQLPAMTLGLLSIALLLLVVSAYGFVTGDFVPLPGEELAALVEVEPGTLVAPFHRSYPLAEVVRGTASAEPIAVTFPVETPSVRLTIHTLDQGRLSGTTSCELPGNLWGIGGQVIEVERWLFLFGRRAFYRLTTVDAKFSDNRLPHVGENLPGYDPRELERRLEDLIPVVDRKVKDLFAVRQMVTDYDSITYTPASRGRRFGVYARREGGFAPRPLSDEEFGRLLAAAGR